MSKKILIIGSGIAGISSSFNTIFFDNHGFESGEIVEYSAETSPVQGLSTSNSYIIKKLNNDSFKLANAGVGGTSIVDYNRGKYADFTTSGEGFQIFNYPKIKVNVDVLGLCTQYIIHHIS